MNKRVLVIVVSYNGMRWLERCLGSVCAVSGPQNEPPTAKTAPNAVSGRNSIPSTAVSADLYVFDNDSTDGSADFVAAHFPQAKLVRSAENLGFSKANNLGFEWAIRKGYDYVYLLNQDAWLEEGALETLVAAAESQSDYAVLSPLQMTDGYHALDAQFSKVLRSARPGRVFAAIQIRNGEKAARVCERAESPVFSIMRVMAAHWLVPVAALKELGPFEEEMFPLYGQDDDWCQRARYAGWKVGVVPGARAVHDRAAREEPLERTVFRNYYTGSLVRLCNVNRPLWERFAFVCLFTLVKAVKYRSFLPFKYFRQICQQMTAVRKHRSAIIGRGKRAR